MEDFVSLEMFDFVRGDRPMYVPGLRENFNSIDPERLCTRPGLGWTCPGYRIFDSIHVIKLPTIDFMGAERIPPLP